MYHRKYWACDNYLCDVDSNAATGVLMVSQCQGLASHCWWFPGVSHRTDCPPSCPGYIGLEVVTWQWGGGGSPSPDLHLPPQSLYSTVQSALDSTMQYCTVHHISI